MNNTNSTVPNLMPLYASALAHAPNIKGDIERLYLKMPEEYYMAAKNSEFYDSRIAKENSLLTEELFKKCLGLICYFSEHHDEETGEGIYNLFKKAYSKTYKFFKDKNPEDFSAYDYNQYMDSYFKRLNYNAYFDNLCAFLYFSKGLCKETDRIIRAVSCVLKGSINMQNVIDHSMEENKKEVGMLYEKLSFNPLDMVLNPKDDDETGLHVIYETESLNSCYIFNELELNKKDIEETILSYIYEKDYGRKCDFETYFLFALHLKAMCKAYNKVKETYFENNKETMYVEMGAEKKALQESKASCKRLEEKVDQLSEFESKRNQKLVQENVQLQKQLRRLQDEITQMKSDSKEVAALRSYIFNQDDSEAKDGKIPECDTNFAKLDKVKGVVIGGFPGWQSKIKNRLRSWKFINAGVSTLDNNLLRNSDVVVFNIKCLSHTLYYKAMDIVRGSDVQIGYINNDNILKGLISICESISAKAS